MRKTTNTFIAIAFSLLSSLAIASPWTYFMGTPEPAPSLYDTVEFARFTVHNKLEEKSEGYQENLSLSDLSPWHESVLQRASAIRANGTVEPVIVEAWAKQPLLSDTQLGHLIAAYTFLKSEGNLSTDRLWYGFKAIEFGRQFNEGIAKARVESDGFGWDSAWSIGRALSSFARSGIGLGSLWSSNLDGATESPFIPAYTQTFLNHIEAANGRMALYNVDYVGSSYREPEVKQLVEFIGDVKTSDSIQNSRNDINKMAEEFAKVAGDQTLQLGSVTETVLLKTEKSNSVSRSIIATALDYAEKNRNQVFLLAFKGKQKYQFFTVSADQHGYLNISFAMTHDNPVVTAIASIPFGELNTETEYRLDEGIEKLMKQNGEQENLVPDFVGIWRVSAK
ncbi:hypothetical protein EOPP23_06970 [Endozoicomonas sp. OPT23]|uniref:hypothetical protein n=1 Tax=Endozoicomonas sp. OPT23 TaxID=2072845 RepID=UPI00129BEAA5|nr:hypothetical protein [Endozoicomonas sp. OPT23]MRI32728.1 hypothetical protein [Endozoicomonas sp. OPT23]